MTNRLIRRTCAAAAALTLGLTLSACGGSGGDQDAEASKVETASNGDVFNGADVRFATEMIPHHAQAIQMAVMTQGRPLDRKVARLVEQIREAQTPEVETMTDWLTDWDKKVPETSLDHVHGGHGGEGGEMPDHDMPGMMTAEQMAELEAAADSEFQDLWLEMMIEHHQGAIEMAETEQEDGRFPDAIALAKSIEKSQAAEIATMEELLG